MMYSDYLFINFSGMDPAYQQYKLTDINELIPGRVSIGRQQQLELGPQPPGTHNKGKGFHAYNENHPSLVNPLGAFIAKGGQKYQQVKRTKQAQVVIYKQMNERPQTRQVQRTMQKKPYNEVRKLLTQGSQRTRISSHHVHTSERGHQILHNFPDIPKDQIKGKQLRMRSDSLSGPINSLIPRQLRHIFDHEKTKSVLQNILIGMQTKLSELQQEKHMKIFGLQIKQIYSNKEVKERENQNTLDNLESEPFEQSAPQIDSIKYNNSLHIEQYQSRKSTSSKPFSTQISLSPTQRRSSARQVTKTIPTGKSQTQQQKSQTQNFRFSLADYGSLSREQLFQLKLHNYHHFLFCVSVQSRVYSAPWKDETLPDLKIKVGRGNNSRLIKDLIRNRWWWRVADHLEPEENLNFYWTQLRVPSYSRLQKKCNRTESLSCAPTLRMPNQRKGHKSIEQSQSSPKQKRRADKFGAYKYPFLKLLSMEEHETLVKVERSLDDFKRFCQLNPNIKIIDNPEKQMIHNHLEKNFYLGNKKAMFYNLRNYYNLTQQDFNKNIPLTFHIQNGFDDPEYQRFLMIFRERQHNCKVDKNHSYNYSFNRMRNIWILKPGEFTNRGNGIQVFDNLPDINRSLSKKLYHQNQKPYTYIIQSYIQNPLLYNKRKFDLRCYMLITSINGILRGYWYEEGYVRTSCAEFSIHDCSNQYIHLTNDAIQKNSDDYGKYENGNKLSFQELQRYLDLWYGEKCDFYRDIYPQMKTIATNSIKSVCLKIDQSKREHNFEIFGFDFMLDETFNPWLIEINTNPCLELSSPLLQRLIPQMVENALRLSLDIIFPPPCSHLWPASKKHSLFYDNIVENNRFQLIFDEQRDILDVTKTFKGSLPIDYLVDDMDDVEEEFYSEDESKN